jgi:hypothetical protein
MLRKSSAGLLAIMMLTATAGASFAQSNTGGVGGTGNTGNETNAPAAMQNDSTGAVSGSTNGNVNMGTSGSNMKPGKNCGLKGENQGTAQVDAQNNCE